MAKMEIEVTGNKASVADFGAAAEKALADAASLLAEKLREKAPVGKTRQLSDSVKPGGINREGAGMYVEVWPQGTRRKEGNEAKAKRNEEIGFIHEHGTTKIPAKHWMSNTVDDAEDAVSAVIESGIADAAESAAVAAIDEAFN